MTIYKISVFNIQILFYMIHVQRFRVVSSLLFFVTCIGHVQASYSDYWNSLCPYDTYGPEPPDCVDCPLYATTLANGETSKDACRCNVDYYMDYELVYNSATGYYDDPLVCRACPTGATTVSAEYNPSDGYGYRREYNDGIPGGGPGGGGGYDDGPPGGGSGDGSPATATPGSGKTLLSDCNCDYDHFLETFYVRDSNGIEYETGQCSECSDGEWSLKGSVSCETISCAAGEAFYHPRWVAMYDDPSGCLACGTGKYLVDNECIECDEGYYAYETGSESCEPCKPGTYSGRSGFQECYSCDDGHEAPDEGMSECNPCSVGSYRSSNDGETGMCIGCEWGTYNTQTAMTTCFDCGIGEQTTTMGVGPCVGCPAGYWRATGGAGTCDQCTAGTYKDSVGTGPSSTCPVGTTSVLGSASAADCKCSTDACTCGEGFHSLVKNLCTLCAAGSFKDITATGACTMCLPGTANNNLGSTTADSCVACGANTWSRSGASICYACISQSTYGDACLIVPWTTRQQNDEILVFLFDNTPVGISIFSHYNPTTDKVSDARGNEYDLDIVAADVLSPPVVVTQEHDIIRNYPPSIAAGEDWTSEDLSTLTATFTLAGKAYGNGDYMVRASSKYNTQSYRPCKVFGYDSVGGAWDRNGYDGAVTHGGFNGEYSLDGTYLGDWITIEHPAPFVMTSFQFLPRSSSPMYVARMPGMFKVYGRNGGIGSWTLLYTQSEDPILTATDLTFETTTTVAYSEYGLVVNKFKGVEYVLHFKNWFFGGYTLDGGAANPVTSLYCRNDDTCESPPSTPDYTQCWVARDQNLGTLVISDWNIACVTNGLTSPFTYVIDQVESVSNDQIFYMTYSNSNNWVHSLYTWDIVLTITQMKFMTQALRKEIGGIPYGKTQPVVPISDLRAYYLCLLLFMRPPQSINIFSEFSEGIVPDRMGSSFQVALTAGVATLVPTIGPSKGANNTLVVALSGDTTTKLLWPENSLPLVMTICSVSRYAGTSNGRIFSGYKSPTQSVNWLHGHWFNTRGVAHYNSFSTLRETLGVRDTWLVMCGSSSSSWPGNIVIDQNNIGSNSGCNKACRLNVNYGPTNKKSDFEIHSLYICNMELSNVQMKHVTSALRAQIGGNPDIADNALGPAVVQMTAAPTAYEQFCPIGWFIESTTGDCIPCAADTYSTTVGAINASTCLACPVNTHSEIGSNALNRCKCLAGYYGVDGFECTVCGAATYTIATGSVTCTECEAGKYKTNPGTETCTLCAAHTYSETVGASTIETCIACPASSGAPNAGSFICKCRPGYIGSWTECTPCDAGTYMVAWGSQCTSCPAGKYKTTTGVGDCSNCEVGSYSLAAAVECTTCPVATTSAVGSDELTDCVCMAGHTGTDGERCTQCDAGTYKHVVGGSVCLTCPVNSFSVRGSSHCECNPEHIRDSDGVSCIPCQQGYSDDLDGVPCNVCSMGYTVDSDGMSCKACLATPYKNTLGSDLCSACEEGTYSNVVGAAVCAVCPSHTTTLAVGSSVLEDCLCEKVYEVASGGGVSCTACGTGGYKDTFGQTPCFPCPYGTTSRAGSDKLVYCICKRGYAANSDGIACEACEHGLNKLTLGVGVCRVLTEREIQTNQLSPLCDCSYEYLKQRLKEEMTR